MSTIESPTEISCKVDLTLTYGEAPGLGRKAQYNAQPVLIFRDHGSNTGVHIEGLGVDLLKPPTISHAHMVFPDGTELFGTVTNIGANGNYFEIIEGAMGAAKPSQA